MKNSFIFAPPAVEAGSQKSEARGLDRELGLAPKTRFQPPTSKPQPFSKVLDRAEQSPPKPKHNPLTGGSSAEHRSERSVEAQAEHKPNDPPRANRRKDKQDDECALQAAVTASLIAPVLPLQSVAPPIMAAGETEVAITVADCSDAASPMASPIIQAASAVLAGDVEGAVSAVDNSLVAGLTPLVGSQKPEVSLPFSSLQLPPSSIGELSPQGEALVAPSSQLPQFPTPQFPDHTIPASSAREVLPGVLQPVAGSQKSEVEPQSSVVSGQWSVVSLPTSDRSWGVERENTRGTSGAKSSLRMNNDATKEEFAGLSQHFLPGAAVSQPATGLNLPSEPHRVASGFGSSLEALSAVSRLSSGPARADISADSDALDLLGASPAARIGEVISREVRMFRRSGDDLVEVVLTPDAKTQISLKLQWRDGQVEVQARCDLGDHGSLNTEWPQLQASLAAHGVRLSHLSERVQTGFTEFFSHSSFSNHPGGDHQPPQRPVARDVADATSPTVVPPSKSGAVKTAARLNARLESWA